MAEAGRLRKSWKMTPGLDDGGAFAEGTLADPLTGPNWVRSVAPAGRWLMGGHTAPDSDIGSGESCLLLPVHPIWNHPGRSGQ